MPLPRPKPPLPHQLIATKGEAKMGEIKRVEVKKAQFKEAEKTQGKTNLVKLSQQAHPASNGTPQPRRREADASKGDGDQAHGQRRDRAKPQAEKAQADKVPIAKSKKAKEFGKTSHTG